MSHAKDTFLESLPNRAREHAIFPRRIRCRGASKLLIALIGAAAVIVAAVIAAMYQSSGTTLSKSPIISNGPVNVGSGTQVVNNFTNIINKIDNLQLGEDGVRLRSEVQAAALLMDNRNVQTANSVLLGVAARLKEKRVSIPELDSTIASIANELGSPAPVHKAPPSVDKQDIPDSLGKHAASDSSSAVPIVDPRVPWADVIEAAPDIAIVTLSTLRDRIAATGFPWRVRDKVSHIEMLLIPPGSYRRGESPGDLMARNDEKPAHEVTLSKPFYLGRFEVTEKEWSRVLGNAAEPKIPMLPKTSVSWDDVDGWLQNAPGLRLPTEAEWEYASRGALQLSAETYGDLNIVAWYGGNSGNKLHSVGEKQPNTLGLCDTLGNASELCSGYYLEDEYAKCARGTTDPHGPDKGERRALRGGFYLENAAYCRVSARRALPSDRREQNIGFRVARTP